MTHQELMAKAQRALTSAQTLLDDLDTDGAGGQDSGERYATDQRMRITTNSIALCAYFMLARVLKSFKSDALNSLTTITAYVESTGECSKTCRKNPMKVVNRKWLRYLQ